MRDDGRFPRGLLPVAAVLLALLVARFWFLTDDAYISFRYARNLVEGHGLVWNPTPEAPGAGEPAGAERPVEGYSNLGWVLVCAGAEWIGLAPELVSRVLGTVAGLLLVLLVARVLGRAPPAEGAAARAVGTLFLATLPPIALWCSGGLETLPFALALFGLHERITESERPRLAGAAAWAAAAVLLRADGVLWVLLVLAPHAPRRARAAATVAAAALVTLAGVVVFRWLTYGDWVPNTARAKISWGELDGDQRIQFLRRGSFYLVSLALAVPSLLVAAAEGARGLRRAPAEALVVAGTCGYALLVGGDFMAMGRFLVPGLAFLAVLCAAGLRGAKPRRVAFVGLVLVGANAFAAFDLSPFPRSLRDRFHFRWNAATPVSEVEMWRNMRARTDSMVLLGRALARHTSQDERATYGPVGAVGYHSRHTIHDTYGLTSRALLERSRLAPSLRSPGHDRTVPPEVLRGLDLTYFEASVVPAASSRRPLPAGAPVRWDEIPLDPTEGFPAGHVLRLLRPR